MTEIQKVAILLVALGPAHARRILDRLSPDEMLPIISAMKQMGKVSIEQRNAVLEEVNDILTDLAEGRTPKTRADVDAGELDVDLFKKLGPYLPERIDLSDIDWSRAGLDFGSRGSTDEDDGEDDDQDTPPRGRL